MERKCTAGKVEIVIKIIPIVFLLFFLSLSLWLFEIKSRVSSGEMMDQKNRDVNVPINGFTGPLLPNFVNSYHSIR
jgi:hypothetical protein